MKPTPHVAKQSPAQAMTTPFLQVVSTQPPLQVVNLPATVASSISQPPKVPNQPPPELWVRILVYKFKQITNKFSLYILNFTNHDQE